MISNSYIFPASGLGFDRACCLTPFASGIPSVSGLGFLGTGDYEQGFIYTFDFQTISPIQGSSTSTGVPSPVIFGDWVFYVLSGQLPTEQTSGGVEFIGGAYGGVDWSSLAFTGTHGLEIVTNFGGILGWDSNIPSLNFVVTGTELFSFQYQVLDTLPEQIEIEFYESSLGWHKVYVGIDKFGLGGTNLGSIAPVLNNWVQVTFTPTQMGLTPGMVITGVAWGVYNSTGTTSIVFSDTANLNAVNTSSRGFIDACQDDNVGFYILSHTGPLFHVPAVGAAPLSISLATNPSFAYTGMTYNKSSNLPFFIGYDGTIYKYTGTVATVTAPPSGVAVPARQLYNDGSNLYTQFANSNDIAKYNIGGNTWLLTASPFTASLDTITYSPELASILAGGSNYLSLNDASTIRSMAFGLAANQLLVTDASNNTKIYNNLGVSWSLSQTIAGTGAPVFIATEPDGNQALVADTTNNILQVLSNIAGTWSATSTVPLTGPSAITMFTSGVVQALVAQPTNNTVSVLNKSVLTWAVGQTLSITGAKSVAVAKNGTFFTGIVTTSTGVTFIQYNGAVWTIVGSMTLNPVPKLAASDFVNASNPYLYAVGDNGTNTTVYIFQGTALLGQYTIPSEVTGQIGVVNYQILNALTSGNIDGGDLIQSNVSHGIVSGVVAPSNPVSLIWVPDSVDFYPNILIAGPNNIWTFYNDKPKSLARSSDSMVGILSGVSWTTIDLQDYNRVASITTDPSGNIFSMTTDNDLYKHTSLGTLVSGYPYTLIPPTNQENGIPLGFSKLLWWRNALYSASSLMGGITKIIP